jgi:hypothetical protein
MTLHTDKRWPSLNLRAVEQGLSSSVISFRGFVVFCSKLWCWWCYDKSQVPETMIKLSWYVRASVWSGGWALLPLLYLERCWFDTDWELEKDLDFLNIYQESGPIPKSLYILSHQFPKAILTCIISLILKVRSLSFRELPSLSEVTLLISGKNRILTKETNI